MVDNLTYLPGLGNSDHACIALDLILPSGNVIDSDDPPIDKMNTVLILIT